MRKFSIGELVYYRKQIGIVQGYYAKDDRNNPKFKVNFGSQSLLIRSDELRKV